MPPRRPSSYRAPKATLGSPSQESIYWIVAKEVERLRADFKAIGEGEPADWDTTTAVARVTYEIPPFTKDWEDEDVTEDVYYQFWFTKIVASAVINSLSGPEPGISNAEKNAIVGEMYRRAFKLIEVGEQLPDLLARARFYEHLARLAASLVRIGNLDSKSLIPRKRSTAHGQKMAASRKVPAEREERIEKLRKYLLDEPSMVAPLSDPDPTERRDHVRRRLRNLRNNPFSDIPRRTINRDLDVVLEWIAREPRKPDTM